MRSIISFAAVLLLFAACNKNNEPGLVNKATDMAVPLGFNYETSRNITFSIAVVDDRFQSQSHIITVYEGNPSEGGAAVIAKGAGTISAPFSGRLDLTNINKDIYVSKKAPDGSLTIKKASITGNRIDLTFENLGGNIETRNPSPSCNSGCNNTINNQSNQNVNTSSGTTCITGTFSGNITIGGNGVVRICGNANISNINFNGNNAQLIITSTGNATFGSFSFNGIVTNYGTMTVNGDLNVNSNGNLINENILTVTQQWNISGALESINRGTINVNQRIQLNSNGFLSNYCNITANTGFTANGKLNNHSFIKCNQEFTAQATGSNFIRLHNGAFLSTKDLRLNSGAINGIGATSLVKVTQSTVINSGGSVTGAIQFCDVNGIETNNGTIGSGATQGCDLYIASNSCFTEGNGTAPGGDGDGDNIPDDDDDFPDDPNGAFGTYFPSQTGTHTLVFEDLWPGLGDFDMNDVVIDFRYQLVTNGQNLVTRINATYILRAAGGSAGAGFGVELPVSRANIASVTGGTLEAGQSKAIIIVFENSKSELDKWNTENGEGSVPVKSYNVSIVLTTPVTLGSIGLGVYNPFIWIVNKGRGHEIHLPGKTPTDLVDSGIFGTGQDNSNPSGGQFYISQNNLPWAIYVPANFSYPIEKADITQAYPNFAIWAQSGGTQAQNWYLPAPGNINASLIYNP